MTFAYLSDVDCMWLGFNLMEAILVGGVIVIFVLYIYKLKNNQLSNIIELMKYKAKKKPPSPLKNRNKQSLIQNPKVDEVARLSTMFILL